MEIKKIIVPCVLRICAKKSTTSSKGICLFALLFMSTSLWAVDPWQDWKTLESEHFRIHFYPDEEALAHKTVAIAERLHAELTTKYQWSPREKTEVVLTDHTDLANGTANPFPYNANLLIVAPPSDLNALENYRDWLELLIRHEYTHIIHLDKVAGAPGVMRKIFGRFSLFFPNAYQPTWLVEGLATHEEGHGDEGIGRGQSNFFSMMMRTEVQSGVKPLSQVNVPLRTWPVGATAYLYGVHFYQFLQEEYGEEAIQDYVNNYSRNLVPYRINSTAYRAVGKKMQPLWHEFEEYLQQQYEPQIAAIHQQGVVAGEQLTEQGFWVNSLRVLENGDVYYVENRGDRHPAIQRFTTDGKIKKVTSVNPGARIDVQHNAGVLIAQPEVCREHSVFYDLYRVKPGGSHKKRLTRCARYPYAAWSPDGQQIVAVHTHAGQSALHLLDSEGDLQEILWQGRNDEVLAYPDWSPTGREIIATVFRAGRRNLEVFWLGTRQWRQLTNSDHNEPQAQYSPDGRAVYYTSDKDGVYNIRRLTLADGQIKTLTNLVTGAFDPVYDARRDVVYYSGYGPKGYDLYRLNLTSQSVHATARMSDAQNFDELPASQENNDDDSSAETPSHEIKDYSPLGSLSPRWWFPYFGTSPDGVGFGVETSGRDALGVHAYYVALAYETRSESPVGVLNYNFNDRVNLNLARTSSVDLDDDAELERVRLEDAFQLTLSQPLTRLEYQWRLALNASILSESDHIVESGIEPLPDTEDGLVGVGVLFGSSERYIKSISPADGRSLRVLAETSDVLDSDYSGDIYTFDWREYIRLGGEHVLALRFVRAWGTENPKPFRLGGENEIMLQPFAVREYNLRGYPEGLEHLIGRRMQMGSAEWRFPLSRVERTWMAPPLGISQLSGSVFVDTGAVWNEGSSPEDYMTGAGVEVTADLVLAYQAGLQLRSGFAHGFDAGGENRIYLSIGAAF